MSRTMTALIATFVASSCWLAACGDGGGGGTPTDTIGGSDTAGPQEGCEPAIPAKNDKTSVAPAAAGGDASPLTGVSRAGVTGTEPTRSAACSGLPAYGPTTGFVYPWYGVTFDGTTLTCNNCPSGDTKLQGRWRNHGFCGVNGSGAADPDLPHPADYAEIFFVDGNTWYTKLTTPEGVYEARGWYVCSDKGEGEVGHARLYWVTTEVLQDTGDTGAHVGEVYKTDVALLQSGGLHLFYYNDPVSGQTGAKADYCIIGSDLNGEVCYDPYTRL